MDAIVEKSIGLDGNVFVERRGASRRRVLKGATLSFNKGYGALECVVRNESEKGALLCFGETSAVPPAFGLTIKGSDVTHAAQVRWRTMTLVGVEFV
jgi:hypothetical protein